ncbi:MAG: peptidase [Gammaproteobacteria bacterium]
MTYCIGMLVDAGLVFLSDSRTNAGVDHINTFRKMNVYERPGDRVIVLLSSGNLAITQSLLSFLKERLANEEARNLWNVPNLFEGARHVGEMLREVYKRDAEALQEFNIEFNAALILGGQIRGEEPRMFSIYAAGNFIEATPETTYFQIGESKYGKPIIDRILNHRTTLDEAAKCALISMDSTIRSNLSVGPPLDLACIRRDELCVLRRLNIDADNAYFSMIRTRWGEGLRQAFGELPDPGWFKDA